MALIEVKNLKMLRETLCAVQTQIALTQMGYSDAHSKRLQEIIDQIDKHRPLGSDGKHGDLHTLTCECDIEAHIGVYGACENYTPHEGHILNTGVVSVGGSVVLQSCPGQYSECANCGDRQCMACVFREVHDDCEKSCPFCC